MTTIILETAGGALGTALGGPVGSIAGRVLGAAGGDALSDGLFGGSDSPRIVEGPRLSEIAGLSSTEGAPIPRVYGRARIGGTVIWASAPLEVATTTVERSDSGSKGGGQKTVETNYSYFIDLAVGLCAGPIALIRRVWADGTELDLTTLTMRLHRGTPAQTPDPLILAKEGAGNAPAYRGLAYVVFERLPLGLFGNRIPQLAFEVIRPVGGLGDAIRAVCLIPGSTEFGLDSALVVEDEGFGATRPANRVQLQAPSDVIASLDALQALCPHLERVSVVVSWFGDDLRAGACTIGPRVDNTAKVTLSEAWSVAGQIRETTPCVSLAHGAPAYGGTPSDAGLLRLVAELRRRSLAVVLYPFVMMDVPAGNALPDPRDPDRPQPPYPWRGRITCHPAPGLPGSPDGGAGATAQVQAFFERPQGYRRLILHYAGLLAGKGLAGFIIGSEFVGLTRVRGPAAAYPAVAGFRALAQSARALLGPDVALVYAADWTEYGAHVRTGGDEVRFPLDPLFADPAIDAVGIDYYPPISDWRGGPGHADGSDAAEIYDRAYLKERLGAGEAFDWYYANDAHRAAQSRTPITDGAHGKPWIFRQKDLVSWWSRPHVERENGVETEQTPWIPGSKPIWLTEIGIPAVDRGTNGPNVFPDPKSSENAALPFSRGTRDDLIQARGIEAILRRFDPALPGFDPAHNPLAPNGGGRMVDPSHIYVWCWDARPFPAFPDYDLVWSDAGNWALGHWITGRIEGQELDRLLRALLADFGVQAPAAIRADGFLDGYVVDRPMSARGALEPLCRLFGLDVTVSAGSLRIGAAERAPVVLGQNDLVLSRDGSAPIRLTRAEDSALPRSLTIGFCDGEDSEYRRATASALRPQGERRLDARIEAAMVTRRDAAEALAEAALEASLSARERAAFRLGPCRIGLEPGDCVTLPEEAGGGLHRILRIADSPQGREIETSALPREKPDRPGRSDRRRRARRRPPPLPGPAFAVPLDLPVTRGAPPVLASLAVAAHPWRGGFGLWRSEGAGAPFRLRRMIRHAACLGRTLTPLPPGRLWRFDRGTELEVALRHAAGLSAIADEAALAGENLFALLDADGAAEIVGAARVELIGEQRFRLSRLLRGLGGSEAQAARTLPAGSLIVRLDDGALTPLSRDADEIGRAIRYRLVPAGRDPADPAATAFTASASLLALRPRAPVHPRARREAAGIRLSWIRRARVAADSWEAGEIPLDEPEEAYAVEILDGADTVLRALEASRPSLLYPSADEIADFGSARSALSLRIAQIGTLGGRGAWLRADVPVSRA